MNATKSKFYVFNGFSSDKVYGSMESDTLIAVCVVRGANSKEEAKKAAKAAMQSPVVSAGNTLNSLSEADKCANFWASRGKKLFGVDMGLQRKIANLLFGK